MNKDCNVIRPLLIDYPDKQLKPEKQALVMEHLRSCPDCSAELEQVLVLFADMKELPQEEPSPAVRDRFYKMLQDETSKAQAGPKSRFAGTITLPRMVFRAAAVIAMLVTGIAIGLLLPRSGGNQNAELATLKGEVTELQKTVVLARLDQQSASQRILAASSVEESGIADDSVINALITTMETDENTNVRMSAMNALYRFRSISRVKDALVNGLTKQTDPVLQITLINMMVDMQEERAVKLMRGIIEDSNTLPAVKEVAEKGLQAIHA